MVKKKQLVEVVPDDKPSVYFNNSQIPKHIDKANVGDKVKFVVEGRVVSKSERKDSFTGNKRKSASIEIDKVKPEKKKVTTKKSTNTKKSK